jgi:Ser-tRNA(Ala) deacylase AlaX
MVVFLVPKEVVEMEEQMELDLNREIRKIAMKYGVNWELMEESKTIDDCVKTIISRIEFFRNQLVTQGTATQVVNIDSVYLKPVKKSKEIEETTKRFEDLTDTIIVCDLAEAQHEAWRKLTQNKDSKFNVPFEKLPEAERKKNIEKVKAVVKELENKWKYWKIGQINKS